ncbi:MAG: KTSC domain-containing protein [Chthoniobacterales bacterium]
MTLSRKLVSLVLILSAITLPVSWADDEVVSRINRQPVVSSNVASVGYSRSRRALEIEFTRGAVYRFMDVPRSVYRELLAADSKGGFIAEHIRDHYRFVRVRPPQRSDLPARLTTNEKEEH